MRGYRFFAALALSLALTATAAPVMAEDALRVGVTAGPHAQIAEVAQQVAARDGLPVRLVEFSDYIQPDAALDARDVDVNIYQHKPFLEAQNTSRGYRLTPVAGAVVQQIGVYSRGVKSLGDLPQDAMLAIPNDPTNGARALLTLQAAGLIRLKPGVTVAATVFDVAENPKKLKFVEIDAAQLTHSLADVAAAVVPPAYAIAAGLSPARDALFLENKDSPFALVVIAAREDNKNDPRIARFVKAYQSPEVRRFVLQKFPGAYAPGW